MAGLCIHCNPPLVGKNKPTKSLFTKDSTSILTLVFLKSPSPAFAPAPGSLDMYTYVNLQKATRLALELFV